MIISDHPTSEKKGFVSTYEIWDETINAKVGEGSFAAAETLFTVSFAIPDCITHTTNPTQRRYEIRITYGNFYYIETDTVVTLIKIARRPPKSRFKM